MFERGLASRWILPETEMQAQRERMETRRADYWNSIKGHKVFRYLESFEAFKCAWHIIENNSVRVKGWNRPADWKFNFSLIVAGNLSEYEQRKSTGELPKFPDSKTRIKTSDYAKQLLSLFSNEGVRLPSVLDQKALERFLEALRREMNIAKVRPRNDQSLLERDTVTSFCVSLQTYFKAISPAIAKDFASMIGYDVENIEPLIEKAKERGRGFLAYLLCASPPKIAK